jgi:hypothetical protein
VGLRSRSGDYIKTHLVFLLPLRFFRLARELRLRASILIQAKAWQTTALDRGIDTKEAL